MSQSTISSKAADGIVPIMGTFFNSGPFTIWLAMLTPVCMGVLWNKKVTVLRITGFTLLVSVIYLEFLTLSRAAIISSLVGASIFIAYQYRKKFMQKKVLMPFFMLLVTIFIVYVSYWLYAIKINSALGRLTIWKIAFGMFDTNSLYGKGSNFIAEKFNCFAAEYYSIIQDSSLSDIQFSGKVIYAFNDILQVGVEKGLIGLLLFLFVILATLLSTLERTTWLVTTLRISLFSLLLASMFSYPFQLLAFWVTLALHFSAIATSSKSKILRFRRPGQLGMSILCVCIIIFLSKNSYSRLRINDIAYRARASFMEHDIANSLSLYRQIYSSQQRDPLLSLTYAKALSRNNMPTESNMILNAAKEFVCDPYLHITQGDNYATLNNYRLAEEAYERSIFLEPTLMYPKYQLAKLHVTTGDSAGAKRLARTIISMKVKVRSTAVDEMQVEMLKLLDDLD